jgi:hypothetical protein
MVEKVPGHRKVLSQPPEAPAEQPARARGPRIDVGHSGDEQPPAPDARSSRLLRVLWLLAFLGAGAALGVLRQIGSDTLPQQCVAACVGLLLAVGLAVRSGGRALPALALALVVGAAAVATQWPTLLAGAALSTGALAACLAVLGTTPARSFLRAIREVLVAEVVAVIGALAVAGFQVGIDADRFGYTVLAVSLAGTVAMVYRLGGGVHALGRSGVLLVGAALVLLALGLAYTAALTRWGSPGLRMDVESVRLWLHDHLGAVPRPIEVFLGVPALAWGVSMRSRRRQGWWVCAFGTAATAAVTTRLIGSDVPTRTIALGEAYSLVLGLLVAFVVIRVVRLVRGTPGRRSAHADLALRRAEPPRLQPLH